MRRAAASLSLLLAALLLGACGSVPESSAPARGEASRGASNVTEGGEAGALAEEALPPQAVQQFEAALVHMNAGDLAAAEQGFRTLASQYPEYSGPLVNLGILEAKAGRLSDAEKTLKSALERNANNAAALNQLGIVYRKLGRFEDADAAYQRALGADPNYANAYLNLGVLCDLYLQQPQRALDAYERYLELAESPDSRVKAWVTELRKRVGAEPQARSR